MYLSNRLRKTIALLTDFGYKDPYVGLMKAVIYGINSEVNIVDITHDITSFSIQEASYILYVSYKYFPRGTIFLVVIDPGVGTKRRVLIIETNNYVFVGPDNGVLYQSALEDGIRNIIEVTNDKFFIKPTSNTFHGRDIFAPIAAYLSLGVDSNVFGKRISVDDIVKFELEVKELTGNKVCGKVLYIDKFGNVVFNIKFKEYDLSRYYRRAKIIMNGLDGKMKLVAKIGKSFGDVKPGEPVVYVNSFNFIELGINKGSAAKTYSLSIGDSVCLELSM